MKSETPTSNFELITKIYLYLFFLDIKTSKKKKKIPPMILHHIEITVLEISKLSQLRNIFNLFIKKI